MQRTYFPVRGFTIVELLIVIVVIGILAAISLVAYNGIQNRAKDSASLSNAQQAGKKVAVYALSNSETLPATLAGAGLVDSGDITYQYTRNTAVAPNIFCLTTTSNDNSAHVAGTTSNVNNAVSGPCPGHTGTSPVVAASGDACPSGFIVVPGSSLFSTDSFCVMKYEAKQAGTTIPVSTYNTVPSTTISQTTAATYSLNSCSGCHLITDNEWLTIAQNALSVDSNWSGGVVGSGSIYSGHNDNSPAAALSASNTDSEQCYGTITSGVTTSCATTGAQRRTLTLTNGEVIWDFAGNVWEWTSGTTTGNQPGSSGFTYREWTASFTTAGQLSPNPFPKYANGSGVAWTSGNGIGTVYSDSSDATLRGFLRGGYWNSAVGAGVFSLFLGNLPSSSGASNGFRVAR